MSFCQALLATFKAHTVQSHALCNVACASYLKISCIMTALQQVTHIEFFRRELKSAVRFDREEIQLPLMICSLLLKVRSRNVNAWCVWYNYMPVPGIWRYIFLWIKNHEILLAKILMWMGMTSHSKQ